MKNIRTNNVFWLLVIMLLGVLVAGGTYAYLVLAPSVTNGNYSGVTECFQINYSINNDNGTQDISGTLFPSAVPSKGLFGKVSINVNQNCSVTGTGTLKLRINSGTSSNLLKTVAGHCEKSATLETLDDYNSSSDCTSAGGVWVTSGTGLKYAVYTNNSATGNPVSKGYITSSSIGSDLVLYDGFNVSGTQQNYYLFIWLDGYITDNTYTNLPFSGYVHASVVQND